MNNITIYKKSFFYPFLFVLVASLFGLSEDSVNWRVFGINSPYVTHFQIAILLVSVFIVLKTKGVYYQSVFKWTWIFSFTCFVSTLINFTNDYLSLQRLIPLLFNVFVMPLGLYTGAYLYENISATKKKDLLLMILQIPALAVSYILLQVTYKFDSDCSFAFFLYIPLIFFFSKDIYQTLFLFLYGIILLLAGKRSITIAYSLIFVSFCVYQLFNKNGERSKLGRGVIITIIIIGILLVFSNYSGQFSYLFERFQGLNDDSGSGREYIYQSIFNSFYNSGLSEQFWGHGYSAVIKDFQIGAHNDLLEIAYDYGIVGLITYIGLLFSIILLLLKSVRILKDVHLTFLLFVCLVNIVVIGFLNCMIASTIFEYTNFMSLGMSLGLIVSNSKYE